MHLKDHKGYGVPLRMPLEFMILECKVVKNQTDSRESQHDFNLSSVLQNREK